MTDSFNIDALLERLADHISSKLAERLFSGSGGRIQPRLLTVSQAASYLGRTKAAIQHMAASSSLPLVRHDRRVFLDRLAARVRIPIFGTSAILAEQMAVSRKGDIGAAEFHAGRKAS